MIICAVEGKEAVEKVDAKKVHNFHIDRKI
jgi:hypothetical protein